jgi:hypothetical protein
MKPAQLTYHEEIRSFLESQAESQEQVLQTTHKSLGEAAHRFRLPDDILELTWGFIVFEVPHCFREERRPQAQTR